jgi:hypothetical protein
MSARKAKAAKRRQRAAVKRRAHRILAMPTGTLTLYSAYFVILFRLIALLLRGVDFPHS